VWLLIPLLVQFIYLENLGKSAGAKKIDYKLDELKTAYDDNSS
jgi:hypothetical protein